MRAHGAGEGGAKRRAALERLLAKRETRVRGELSALERRREAAERRDALRAEGEGIYARMHEIETPVAREEANKRAQELFAGATRNSAPRCRTSTHGSAIWKRNSRQWIRCAGRPDGPPEPISTTSSAPRRHSPRTPAPTQGRRNLRRNAASAPGSSCVRRTVRASWSGDRPRRMPTSRFAWQTPAISGSTRAARQERTWFCSATIGRRPRGATSSLRHRWPPRIPRRARAEKSRWTTRSANTCGSSGRAAGPRLVHRSQDGDRGSVRRTLAGIRKTSAGSGARSIRNGTSA